MQNQGVIDTHQEAVTTKLLSWTVADSLLVLSDSLANAIPGGY